MADAYDLLRFAVRGHGAVRVRMLRAAESLCKGEPAPEPIAGLLEEFDVAHQRLVDAIGAAAEQGPAPLPVIPQPSHAKVR